MGPQTHHEVMPLIDIEMRQEHYRIDAGRDDDRPPQGNEPLARIEIIAEDVIQPDVFQKMRPQVVQTAGLVQSEQNADENPPGVQGKRHRQGRIEFHGNFPGKD